ncbi:MAG: hypothetical protein ABH879_02970 [archaeon]
MSAIFDFENLDDWQDLLEADGITAEEEGFMQGWLLAGPQDLEV